MKSSSALHCTGIMLSLVASGVAAIAPSKSDTSVHTRRSRDQTDLWPSFDKARARSGDRGTCHTPLPMATATRMFTPRIRLAFGHLCGYWGGGRAGGGGGGGGGGGVNGWHLTSSSQTHHALAPWHFLYFFPDPQGQGSLRPPQFCPTSPASALQHARGRLILLILLDVLRRSIHRATAGKCCGSLDARSGSDSGVRPSAAGALAPRSRGCGATLRRAAARPAGT